MTWDMATIGTVCSTYSGGTPSTANSEYYDGNIPWIASAELNQGRIASTRGHISKLGLERSAAKMVEPGTPLIALYGATAGVPAITGISGAINQAVLAMVPKGVDAEFLYQWLRANRDEIIDRYTQGGQPNLSGAIVRSIEIPLPSMPEQKRVSGALRDADDLIATLERLIAKKQAIKQGMMQQLLTGRTRLPGFTDPWSSVTLGDIARFGKGSGLPKSALLASGSDFCIHYGELFTFYGAEIRHVASRTNAHGRAVRAEDLDVLMPTSDVTPRGLAKASAVHGPGVVLGGDILIIRADRSRAYGPFVARAIRRDVDQVLQLVRGSTVYHLYASDMRNFALAMPSVDEQRAISEVLVDAEDEFNVLEQRLVKARAIKTGMMQQLLTGRTRLPVEVSA